MNNFITKQFELMIVLSLLSFGNIESKEDNKLTITSPAFEKDAMVPLKYSCEGENISPALKINDAPKGTVSLAIILHDPDAPMPGGFTHWVLWNITSLNGVPENFKGAEQGLNGKKEKGYTGMCPPTGTHHYHFMVYALDTKLDLDAKTDKVGLESAMKGHVLSQGEIVGLYKKQK